MAGSADDDQRRRGRREIEEGEASRYYHAGTGSDTDTDDEDARYYLNSSYDNDEYAGPAWRNSAASTLGSGRTISAAVVNAAVAARESFPCGVCGKEFISSKAVNGHMRVHAQAAREEKQIAAAVSGGASAVGKVGGSVSESVAVMPELYDDKITTPVPSVCSNDPVVTGASGSSSARSSVESSPTGHSMANVVAAPEHVPVAPPSAPPQQDSADLHPLHIMVRSDPMAPAGNSQRVFPCRECDQWFPTHQGLGGHVAGHKNRRIAAEAAAAAAAGIDPQEHTAEKSHACKICGAVYSKGVSLGGHMRKHYSGEPIVPRKRQRPCFPKLAQAPPLQQAPSSMEAPFVVPPLASYEQEQVAPVVEAAAQPQQAPAVPGTLRLFGVNIVQQTQKEKEVPPVDETMNEQ